MGSCSHNYLQKYKNNACKIQSSEKNIGYKVSVKHAHILYVIISTKLVQAEVLLIVCNKFRIAYSLYTESSKH